MVTPQIFQLFLFCFIIVQLPRSGLESRYEQVVIFDVPITFCFGLSTTWFYFKVQCWYNKYFYFETSLNKQVLNQISFIFFLEILTTSSPQLMFLKWLTLGLFFEVQKWNNLFWSHDRCFTLMSLVNLEILQKKHSPVPKGFVRVV